MAGGAERVPERADQERTHGVGVAEPELGLGRMDVHVNLLGRDAEEQGHHGIASLRQEIAIGGAHRAGEQLVAHRAPVHREVELGAIRPVQRGEPGEALDRDLAAQGAHRQRVVHEILAQDAAEPRQPMVDQPGRAGLEPERGALAIGEAEGDLGLGQSEPLHHVGDRRALGPLGFHEFEPRRGRVEQIAHLDPRAGAERSRLELRFSPGIDRDLVGLG